MPVPLTICSETFWLICINSGLISLHENCGILYLQLLAAATSDTQKTVRWSSLPPQLAQQPNTPAIRATVSTMETAPALVKLMDSGLGTHPLVNVSEHVTFKQVIVILWLQGFIVKNHPIPEGAAQDRGCGFQTMNS